MIRIALLGLALASSGCELLFPGPDPIDAHVDDAPLADAPIDAVDVDAAIDAVGPPLDAAIDGAGVACTGLRVVFDDGGGTGQEVFVAELDGTQRVVIAPSTAMDFGPAGSIDGHVALQSARDGNFQIYVARADGSMAMRLAPSSTSARYPAFSHGGTRVAFAQAGALAFVDRDGSDLLVVPSSDVQSPAWSADDRLVVALRRDLTTSSTRHLVVGRTDGVGALVQVTAGDATQRNASWSPDNHLVFESEDVNVAPPQIWISDGNGNGLRLLTDGTGPSWSPDGATIAFSLGGHIMTIPTAGGTAVAVSTGPAQDTRPQWSPDGARLLWIRDSGAIREVVVAGAGGANPRSFAGPASYVGAAAWVGCD